MQYIVCCSRLAVHVGLRLHGAGHHHLRPGRGHLLLDVHRQQDVAAPAHRLEVAAHYRGGRAERGDSVRDGHQV